MRTLPLQSCSRFDQFERLQRRLCQPPGVRWAFDTSTSTAQALCAISLVRFFAELFKIASSAPKIGGPDFRVLAKGIRAVMQEDAAGLEDVAVVRDLERKVGVLLDQQDGQPKRSD